MVLGRNDKRKKKEGDLVDLMDPLSEAPKRAKVHAQRKFAQGAATVFNSVQTVIKEKEKTKPSKVTELITDKRPNTEDFLTFLCFRGTSILPPSLNFFGIGTKKEKIEAKLLAKKKVNNTNSQSTISTTTTTTAQSKTDINHNTGAKIKTTDNLKKKLSTAQNVGKNINKYKTTTSTVQALKKKYQEQRLAKQRIEKKLKVSCVMKTRSSTTSRAIVNKNITKNNNKLANIIDNNKKHCLRSNSVVDKRKTTLPKNNNNNNKLLKKEKKKTIDNDKNNELSEELSDSSFSSEDSNKSSSSIKQKNNKTNNKKNIITRSNNKIEQRRVTRSRSDVTVPIVKPTQRPSRKTKEAAASLLEIISKKLTSPDIDSDDDDDDNNSLDSYPELIRKTIDNDNKSKIKGKLNKEKNLKTEINKVDKLKNNKTVTKIKKSIKVRKYIESDDNDEDDDGDEDEEEEDENEEDSNNDDDDDKDEDDEDDDDSNESSASEKDNNKKSKPVTRKSSNQSSSNVKAISSDRSLRSSSRNLPKQQQKQETPIKLQRDNKKSNELKRKSPKLSTQDDTKNKDNNKKLTKNIIVENLQDSDDEPLIKLKKRIEMIDNIKNDSSKDNKEKITFDNKKDDEIIKLSDDDEESFHGFNKKTITKLLNPCTSSSIANEETCKIKNSMETLINKIENINHTDNYKNLNTNKSCEISNLDTTTNNIILPMVSSSSPPLLPPPPNTTEIDKKCSHTVHDTSTGIIDIPLSTSLGRKERVNMSTEQIEKWLNESSMAKEESKAEMETVTNFSYEVEPEKINKSDISHLSISTRIQHLVRPVNVAIAKMAEKPLTNKNQMKSPSSIFSTGIALAKPINIPTNRNKINADIKEIIKCRNAKNNNNNNININHSNNNKDTTNINEDSDISSRRSDGNVSIDYYSPDKKNTSTTTTSTPTATPTPPITTATSTTDKKSTTQSQKKTFLPKVKERKSAIPSVNAFSPENERSVYAFESDTETPVNTPFRRKLRDSKSGTSSDIAESDDGIVKTPTKISDKYDLLSTTKSTTKSIATTCNEDDSFIETPSTSTDTPIQTNIKLKNTNEFDNLSNSQVLPIGKHQNVWNSLNCSTSIAVQVNFDEQGQSTTQDNDNNHNDDINNGQKCTEISTQTECTAVDNEDDNSSQVFYIPLQAVSRNGPNTCVAVKLGTEGPNGPNQRVLLRAQLVTKPPVAVARCPPIGTVQPTTRTPASLANDSIPSTSSSSLPAETVGGVTTAATASSSTTTPTPPTTTSSSSSSPIVLPIIKETEKLSSSESNSKVLINEKITKSLKASRERKASSDSSTTKLSSNKKGGGKKKLSSDIKFDGTTFPSMDLNKGESARLVDAPTFHPSEKDFQDPFEYIDKIRPIAEKFGICRVVPPSNFKPDCKVSDDMRFTAYNQYVHRMMHRWGPNVKQLMAIKKNLASQHFIVKKLPWIGGMEVDLPHLYETVQNLGGLGEIIDKKKWQKVADGMKIPKSAQDRASKLDDIYCRYLLPFDTLSAKEKEKLFDDVDKEWKKREAKALRRLNKSSSSSASSSSSSSDDDNDNDDEESDDSADECIVKGRNMPLNAFYRIARNTQRMWFGDNQRGGGGSGNGSGSGNGNGNSEIEGASAVNVENDFWKHVVERKRHVCVHAASIDSSGRGFGFSVAKKSPFARHPWNLKVLTNNSGSILRALGPLMGVTIPTLHVGMLFSACCWYRDPHGLPWIEYLHTGAKKIWYGIPNEHNDNFRIALSKMVPRYCKNKKIWLPSDTAMVPPETLVSNGVSLCQTVQEPGQFIIVFPKAFTSSICTGYVVSESVYFAQPTWLENAEQIFKDLQDSCEPSMFSFERLLFSIINDTRSNVDVLKQILPTVTKIRERELNYRQQLDYYGLTSKEKLPLPDSGKKKKGQKVKDGQSEFECETCRMDLFVSHVCNSQDDSTYCLPHALQLISKKKQVLKHCTLKFSYSEEELDDLIHKLEDRIEAKLKKTNQNRQIK
ncbi:hypothetical protein HCN44_003521 [Aphidius gifuensis]|uniref:Protein Jumonji n=1 Tax=Aphidius gifuensis TaxID=684658 RepID=A0A834XIF3_APHGI|nr:protein Jumonji [Aphidius gifuensis]KAF7987658.1 hypothetical protein HCN44_003521 [Aphidius gifuensis]